MTVNLKYHWALWLYISIPLLVLLFAAFMFWRKRMLRKLTNESIRAKMFPNSSSAKLISKFILLTLALALTILALADPLAGQKSEKIKREGVDIIFAMDVSRSMLAEDIKPSRLERSKMFVSKFIDQLKSDRVGLIVFAGRAYMQMPVTIDYRSAKMFLDQINTDMVPTQGTSIADAVYLASRSFKQDEHTQKVLVIITDGEDHEGEDEEAVKAAQEQGIRIYTVGVGDAKGAPIPDKSAGGYKKDRDGNVILSKLNETMLRQLAAEGKGSYYNISSGNNIINAVMREIEQLQKTEFEESVFTEHQHYFQLFLLPAIILLIIEAFIGEQKSIFRKLIKKLRI